MQVEVLRLSHRIRRDPRLSTHVALTARAFLANKLYYSGDKDSSLEETINKVAERFGGDFKIEHAENSVKLIEQKKKKNFLIVHLSVYGLALNSVLAKIKNSKKILMIIGGEKVQPEIFQISMFQSQISLSQKFQLSLFCCTRF